MIEGTELEAIAHGNDLSVLFEQAEAASAAVEWVDAIPGADEAGLYGIGVITRRHDYSTEVIDLQDYMPWPRRAQAKVQLQDTQSFIDYARRFDFDGPTGDSSSNPTLPVIYINRRNGPVAELIIDDHSENHPGWREHRATLAWQYTPEWKRWKADDRKMLPQAQFAEMIEDGLDDILEPDAGDLLEIAQTIKGTMTATVKSGRYLQDGTIKAVWDEELDVTGGREADITIPGHFILQIRVLEEGTPIQIRARLRYAFRDRKLQLGYFLDRPLEREYSAVNAEVDLIRAGVSPTTLVVLGHPG